MVIWRVTTIVLAVALGACGEPNYHVVDDTVKCGSVGYGCSTASDCCAPLNCPSGVCSTPSVCRATGQLCVNTNDCCVGLVCAGGTCATGQVSTLTWNMTDSCLNGENIEVEFNDTVDHLAWPGNGQVFIAVPGQSSHVALSCKTGTSICIGGLQPNHNLGWYAGLDGTRPCTFCCVTCTNEVTSSTFTCP